MTATDELRRLLDERGVEWAASTLTDPPITLWGTQEPDGHWPYKYWEYGDGSASFMADPVTPQQAIDATLGRGTCHMDLVGYTEREDTYQCRSCDWTLTIPRGRLPRFNYCPNCGRRVIS